MTTTAEISRRLWLSALKANLPVYEIVEEGWRYRAYRVRLEGCEVRKMVLSDAQAIEFSLKLILNSKYEGTV